MEDFNPELCCEHCPFLESYSEEAWKVQCLGCLPSAEDNLKHFDKNGESISCHETGKICRGLKQYRPAAKSKPIKSYSDWYSGV